MKRLLVCSTIIAALLLLPAAAPAFTGPLHGRPAAAATHVGAVSGLTAPQKAPLRGPLLGVLTGAATVTCKVWTLDGAPEDAAVLAYVWGDTDYGTSQSGTVSGVATLTGLPDASGNGEVVVIPNPDSPTTMYDLTNLDWAAATNPNEMGIQPGALWLLINRSSDPYYNSWPSADVELTAEETNGVHFAETEIPQNGAATSAYASTISLGSATLDWGAIYYWSNEGAELPVAGFGISPGVAYPTTLTLNEAAAQAVWMNGWGSGKPGAATWLGFRGYPAGWINAINAQATWPFSAATKSFGSMTMTGAKTQAKKLTIPSTVKPGYAYSFDVSHRGGALALSTWFQTCTLAASKTTISHGGAVRLSGVIPTAGPLGLDAGQGQVRRDLQAHHERGAAPLLGRDEVGVDQGGRRQG